MITIAIAVDKPPPHPVSDRPHAPPLCRLAIGTDERLTIEPGLGDRPHDWASRLAILGDGILPESPKAL